MLSRLRVDGVAAAPSRDAPKTPLPPRESHDAEGKHKTPLTTATTQARTELRAHRLTHARAVPRAELQPNRGPDVRTHPFANIRALGRAEPAADAATFVKTDSGAVL